jgi:hypothetical protein
MGASEDKLMAYSGEVTDSEVYAMDARSIYEHGAYARTIAEIWFEIGELVWC